MKLRSRLAAIATAAALLTGIPIATYVDSTEGEAFTLDCGDAGTNEITTPPGNGHFTPGFFTDSQQLIIPLAFNISGTAALPDGEVMPLFSDSSAKGQGNAHPNRDTLTRTISEQETITDPDDESDLPVGTVISFEGTVTGFLTGGSA